jgi:hypothetical protein
MAPSEHRVVKWLIKESACRSSLSRWAPEPAATADRAGIMVFRDITPIRPARQVSCGVRPALFCQAVVGLSGELTECLNIRRRTLAPRGGGEKGYTDYPSLA